MGFYPLVLHTQWWRLGVCMYTLMLRLHVMITTNICHGYGHSIRVYIEGDNLQLIK
jgi:hypothetical protein